jgi:hypothetical protein
MSTNPMDYKSQQNELTKSRIREMTDSELEEFIKAYPVNQFNAYARKELRKRKQEERIFTRTQAWIITISTALIALCSVGSFLFQMAGIIE